VKRVVIESPFAAETPEGEERNLRYLRACMHHSITHDEAPFASATASTRSPACSTTRCRASASLASSPASAGATSRN
jgi:hypothetical protein